jgi:hypothetical protein
MQDQFEYYRVHRDNDDSIPILASDSGNPSYLYDEQPIGDPKLMLFKLGKPVPKKPKMADYLSSPSCIISRKLLDVLDPLKVEGIQLLPAQVRGKNDEIFSDYWAIHIYHNLKCVDTTLSDCVVRNSGLGYVKKLVLDKKVLEKIPLDKRLIFRLGEDPAYQLFHISIVDAIMAVKPEGIRFTNIEEWNEGSFFQN